MAWSKQKEKKEKKLKRREVKEKKRKRKAEMDESELDELASDSRLLKKLKKGKVLAPKYKPVLTYYMYITLSCLLLWDL